jgi:teichuronic acid biosynthesis glycosyltransferase TuaH
VSRAAQLEGDWSGLVVIFAEASWDERALLDQHFALGLSAYAPVLYVDPPVAWRAGPLRRSLRPPRAMSRAMPVRPVDGPTEKSELQVIGPRLARLTPQLPPATSAPGGPVAAGLVRRSLRRALASLGAPRVQAMVSFVPDAPLGVGGAARRVLVVREGTTVPAEMPLERRRNDPFDLVVVTSPALAERLRDRDPLLLPYGCLEMSPSDGFVGQLSARLDLTLLSAVVERGTSLLMVGPCSRPESMPGLVDLLQNPLVTWVGPRARSAIGPYLREIDVGLVPYADTEANQLTFPTKTLDYLAAGRPVVSTDLASTRWLRASSYGSSTGDRPAAPLDRHEDLVIAAGPEMFSATVARLVGRDRTRSAVARRQAFARTHSWDRRIGVLATALGLPGGSSGHADDDPTTKTQEAVA